MKRFFLYTVLLLLLIGSYVTYSVYSSIYHHNIRQGLDDYTITIPSESSFEDVVTILTKQNLLKDVSSFADVAGWMRYKKDDVPSGVYDIQPEWNNRQLIGHLRSGNQAPTKVTFNNVRTIQELSGKLTAYLEPDSVSFLNTLMSDEKLSKLGLNSHNVMSLFIPNTYNFFWDVSSHDIINRMKRENDIFWSQQNRLQKAEALGLTKEEVYSLASIVEKESLRKDEKPIIAGLYLNRVNRGMLLQADPTVVFALGDFTIRRVLKKHLIYDSPFNTYINAGIPPGPIYMPSISSIDAVLNPKQHNYLYMCAKPGYNSEHAFAATSAGHAKNARAYHRWLDAEKIKK